MRNALALALCLAVVGFGGVAWGGAVDDTTIILRGDSNMDGCVDMADATYITNWLYSSGPEPGCMNQADVNDDTMVDLADALFIVNWLYNGGPTPP